MIHLLVPALLSSNAFAWQHIDPDPYIWIPDDMPIEFYVADDGMPNSVDACDASGGMSGCCEESVPAGYCAQVAQEGFAAWTAAACAEFSYEYVGVCPNLTGFSFNGANYITFNDPFNELELGVLAAALVDRQDVVEIINGVGYKRALDGDIVFNQDVEFTTNELIEQGLCSDQVNMRGVITHEIGHILGMDHSCEDPDKPEQGGGPCPDPLLLHATMFWNEGPCETEAIDINQDDIEGFTVLYGPFATFQCSHTVSPDLAIGVVPMDLHCVVASEFLAEVQGASWVFGDGGVSEELNPTHTYAEPGNYTIQVTVDGARAECDDPETTEVEGWSNTYRKVGYVRACGVPDAAFVVDHVDGLKYQMLNDSDVSVYGCISDIVWEVYKGTDTGGEPISTAKAWEPIIDFPEEGEYTVVLNLGGIAGTGAASATFEAKNHRGEGYGCSTVGASAGMASLLMFLVSAGWLRARRPRDP